MNNVITMKAAAQLPLKSDENQHSDNCKNIFVALTEPFSALDIEWRVQSSGISANGTIWAMAIPYITNRVIQNRLDEVFGPMGWKNEYTETKTGDVLCGISAWNQMEREWVTKWDGAEKSQNKQQGNSNRQPMDNVKKLLSDSMKRAAVQWGIGRYLYKLESVFVDIYPKGSGKNNAKIIGRNGSRDTWYSWNPPILPVWALPENEKKQQSQQNVPVQAAPWPNHQQNDNREPPQQQNSVQNVSYEFQKPPANNQPPASQAGGGADFVLNRKQIANLRNAIEMANVTEEQFCRSENIPQIEQLTQSRIAQSLEWLKRKATQ